MSVFASLHELHALFPAALKCLASSLISAMFHGFFLFFACLFHTHVGIYASGSLRMQWVLIYLQIPFEFGIECLSNSVCSRTML